MNNKERWTLVNFLSSQRENLLVRDIEEFIDSFKDEKLRTFYDSMVETDKEIEEMWETINEYAIKAWIDENPTAHIYDNYPRKNNKKYVEYAYNDLKKEFISSGDNEKLLTLRCCLCDEDFNGYNSF